MTTSFEVRCRCDAFAARANEVSSTRWNRVVCYCDDCQAFARHLGQEDLVLDANGGTDVLQTSPARMQILSGYERLACLRLRAGGIVRWHTSCCRTPLFNTLATHQIPFVGIVLRSRGSGAISVGDEELGAVRARIFARFAIGPDVPSDAQPGLNLSGALSMLPKIVLARLRGEHRRSPFFDEGGELVASPYVLSPDELESALDSKRA